VTPYRFHEYFCGGGMARLGLGAGWACTFGNDIDVGKAAAYAANFGRGGLVVADIANVTVENLPGAVDLAWSSFPCQDVSLAGDRAGLDGARSNTFWSFWRLMQALRAEGRAPRIGVIENVTGLLSSHDGKDFTAICDALTEGGYRYGAIVIDAALFVPQSRERMFIVAIDAAMAHDRAAVNHLEADGPFHPPGLVKALRRQKAEPIWWRLPVPPARNSVLIDLIEDHPTGVSWHPPAETDRVIKMMTPTNIAKLDEAKRAGRRMVGGLYKRMRDEPGGRVQRAEVRFDDVAGCLRMPTGGSSVQTIMIVDGANVRTRRLSAREAARLMGVGDDYRLPDNYLEAYGLMADGVAPPVVRHLAAHILEPLITQAAGSELVSGSNGHSSPRGRAGLRVRCVRRRRVL
jgi:DNA (cytosine-5)-methyltransferase 1